MKQKFGSKQAAAALRALGWDVAAPLGIEVRIIKRRRSNDQNALYWEIVTALANFAGYSKEEMHDEILCDAFGYELVAFRGSERKRPLKRSSQLTTEEFSPLIETAQRWCAEQGVAWDREAA